MKQLSFLLVFLTILSTITSCSPAIAGNNDMTNAIDISTYQQETNSVPEEMSTETEVETQTTIYLDTTETPEATITPETTTSETEVIVPRIEVSTFDELSKLATDGGIESGTTISIVKDIEITSELRFTVPLSLSIAAKLLCSSPIVFETPQEGQIEIAVASGIDTSALNFYFDAPNCDLIWLTGAPFADPEQAAQELNVKTYNGVSLKDKYGLGGNGNKKIASFSMGLQDNGLLDSSIEWSIQGNTVYAAISYLVNYNALKNANVKIVLSDGSVVNKTMDLTVSEQTLSIQDKNGNERTYKIITDRITYNLPVIYIDIEGGEEVTSREDYLRATIRVDTTTAYGDFPGLDTTEVNIRGRGHFSWQFDKTPYKLKFDKKTSILGMNASKDWVLLANYVDRSLIQNYVALEMGKVMTNIPYHSSQYPVDIFVNGTYRGVYTFGEQLEAKKERINLVESYEDVDTDYLLEIGGNDEGDILGRDFFHSYVLKYVKIKHPDSDKLSQAQLDYLIGYVNQADLAVRSLTNYEDYIDIDSLIDWVIIHELTYNLDCCFRRSCYLIKEKGGKLKMGPIWDFDLGFGNYRRYTTDNWATVGSDGGYVWVTWMNYLMKDEAFMKRFTARWNEIKEPLLQKAIASVETMSELVAPSAEMNFEVWDILGKDVLSQPTSHKKYDTYEKMIERLKTFLINRYNWMDKQLN